MGKDLLALIGCDCWNSLHKPQYFRGEGVGVVVRETGIGLCSVLAIEEDFTQPGSILSTPSHSLSACIRKSGRTPSPRPSQTLLSTAVLNSKSLGFCLLFQLMYLCPKEGPLFVWWPDFGLVEAAYARFLKLRVRKHFSWSPFPGKHQTWQTGVACRIEI